MRVGALEGTRSSRRRATPPGTFPISFPADKLAFVGDTLFSIGCGRVIEGNPEMMWHSLLKLRGLPDDTRFYCGHEYTAANIRFAKTIEPNNKALAARAEEVTQLLAAGEPTIPATIGAEKAANPFLRADDAEVAKSLGLGRQSGLESVCGNPRAQEQILTASPATPCLTADAVIRLLDLKPHPEGGHFRETFRDARQIESGRAASTAIYFLLARGERSHWHRIDAVEVWHWYAGAPLVLEIAARRATHRAPDARRRSCRRRAPAGGRAGACLAGGANARRLDAVRLHRRAGF